MNQLLRSPSLGYISTKAQTFHFLTLGLYQTLTVLISSRVSFLLFFFILIILELRNLVFFDLLEVCIVIVAFVMLADHINSKVSTDLLQHLVHAVSTVPYELHVILTNPVAPE